MGLIFYGDYKEMLKVRDEVLIPQGYQPHDVLGKAYKWEDDPLDFITSPDGRLTLQFIGNGVQVGLDSEMFTSDGHVKEKDVAYLEEIVRLLNPESIVSQIDHKDLTSQFRK